MAGVRIARADDARAIAAIYAPYVRDTPISFEEDAPTPEEMRERVIKTLRTHPYLVYENEGDGAVVAFAYAAPLRERVAYRWTVEVAIYADAAVHGRKIGRALYSRLLADLARQGFHTAFAGIALPNDKSVGLHEAMGFRHVGTFSEVGFKLGSWRDVGWWQVTIGQGAPRAEPVPFSELD
ncbi:MAG TPA: arsinothricin resistance N-acetyltransferase ArsN1 family B [Caulobacteraceae bacterium]|nr:arsinothricin resistance N-acetyltransferase ArsN1 family B [Caulobacteraceae bacterium]